MQSQSGPCSHFAAHDSEALEVAGTLAVSLEELIGEKNVQPAKRGPAPKLQQQIERIQQLPRSKQRFVIEMLDTVLAQASR